MFASSVQTSAAWGRNFRPMASCGACRCGPRRQPFASDGDWTEARQAGRHSAAGTVKHLLGRITVVLITAPLCGFLGGALAVVAIGYWSRFRTRAQVHAMAPPWQQSAP